MICEACKYAAAYAALSNSWDSVVEVYHTYCDSPATCSCQHRLDAQYRKTEKEDAR